MKAGFKPKEFSKKEWQNNRISKCKGSGVGKALENFGTKASFNLREMDRKENLEAMKAVNTLNAALDVAKGKCDKVSDSNMIKGIEAYQHILKNYKKALAMTNLALVKRAKYFDEAKADKIMKDAVFLKYMMRDAKQALYATELTAYVMSRKNKLGDAVRKWGKANDYHITGDLNNALIKVYIEGAPQEQLANDKRLKRFANKNLKTMFDTSMYRMIVGSVSSFKTRDTYKQLLDVKFPILNFSY
jgi:hypothetical protein